MIVFMQNNETDEIQPAHKIGHSQETDEAGEQYELYAFVEGWEPYQENGDSFKSYYRDQDGNHYGHVAFDNSAA